MHDVVSHRQLEDLISRQCLDMSAEWLDPLFRGLDGFLHRSGSHSISVEEGHLPILVVGPKRMASRIKQVRVNSQPGHLTFDLERLEETFKADGPYLCLDVAPGTEVIGYLFEQALEIASMNRSLCTAREGIDLARQEGQLLIGQILACAGSRTKDGAYPLFRMVGDVPSLDLVRETDLMAMDPCRVRLAIPTCGKRVFPHPG